MACSRACGVAFARRGLIRSLLIVSASMVLSGPVKMSQGSMDIRPLNIQLMVLRANTMPRM